MNKLFILELISNIYIILLILLFHYVVLSLEIFSIINIDILIYKSDLILLTKNKLYIFTF